MPIHLTVVAGLLLSTLAVAQDDAGLVARWGFDGSLADGFGVGPDTLAAADATPRFLDAAALPGAVGQALALGVEPADVPYLTAPLSDDIRLGPIYTVEAWIHPVSLAGWNRIVLNWGAQFSYHLALHNGRASLYHCQADGEFAIAEGGAVSMGRWQHIAGVAERNEADPAASTVTIYLDGRRVGRGTFDGTIAEATTEALGIGDAVGIPSPEVRYRGYLDDVAIWKRALSADEVRAHYDARAPTLLKLDFARRAEASERLADLGVAELIYAERTPVPGEGHWYANFGYYCHDADRKAYVPGGRLCRANLRTGEVTALLDDPEGTVRDPQLHYDAQRILFSYRPGGTEHFHLHEVNVDGSGLRQLTDGACDDIEPTYLPDGDIIFCSSRCNRYVNCYMTKVATLYRCGPDGGGVRELSANIEHDNTPWPLSDGRVMYQRWEYVDRSMVNFHHLWAMNPDGTGQMILHGNLHPGGVFIDAKPIPTSGEVLFIHSPGHGMSEHQGYVGIIDPRLGPGERSAQQIITATPDFRDPYPLSPGAFLVAKANQILLMDREGTTHLVRDSPFAQLHEPRPLVPRRRERVRAPQVVASEPTGKLVLMDVYQGRNMAGVERGEIEELLVVETLPKPANFSGGMQAISWGGSGTLERIVGTVPVEDDGSAYMELPANRSLFLIALDRDGRSVKRMQSFLTVMPGETSTCIGCHEQRTEAPGPVPAGSLAALTRPASRVRPVSGIPDVLDFPRDIQPVLDRHCVACHSPARRDGGVLLTGDRGPHYSHSYYTLFVRGQVSDGRDYWGNTAPRAIGDSASPLMKKLRGGHYDALASEHERKLVRHWIHTGANYPGTYAALGTGMVGKAEGPYNELDRSDLQWPSVQAAQDVLKRRCASCHTGALALPDSPSYARWLPCYPGSGYNQPEPSGGKFNPHILYNLTHPEQSGLLLAPLAREAGGWGMPKLDEQGNATGKCIEIFADTSDPDYQLLLASVVATKEQLGRDRRFDMPDFRPRPEYIREMQRYGVLPAALDPLNDPVDPYATDRAYWRSLWYQPPH